LANLNAEYVIADKGYDSDKLLGLIEQQGSQAVIPPKSNRKVQREYDTHLYKERHLIECLFNKLKRFRRVATRYDKTAASFLGFIYLTASILWIR
jgi:putative transposase